MFTFIKIMYVLGFCNMIYNLAFYDKQFKPVYEKAALESPEMDKGARDLAVTVLCLGVVGTTFVLSPIAMPVRIVRKVFGNNK